MEQIKFKLFAETENNKNNWRNKMKQKVTFYKLGIESKLWHAFKVKCAQEGVTMLSMIQKLITSYVSKGN